MTKDSNDKNLRLPDDLASDHTTPEPPAVEIDLSKYVAHLDGLDLTPDEKNQMLTTLWIILQGFVDLGFAFHLAPKACGQVSDMGAPGGGDAVNSIHPLVEDSLRDFASAATMRGTGGRYE